MHSKSWFLGVSLRKSVRHAMALALVGVGMLISAATGWAQAEQSLSLPLTDLTRFQRPNGVLEIELLSEARRMRLLPAVPRNSSPTDAGIDLIRVEFQGASGIGGGRAILILNSNPELVSTADFETEVETNNRLPNQWANVEIRNYERNARSAVLRLENVTGIRNLQMFVGRIPEPVIRSGSNLDSGTPVVRPQRTVEVRPLPQVTQPRPVVPTQPTAPAQRATDPIPPSSGQVMQPGTQLNPPSSRPAPPRYAEPVVEQEPPQVPLPSHVDSGGRRVLPVAAVTCALVKGKRLCVCDEVMGLSTRDFQTGQVLGVPGVVVGIDSESQRLLIQYDRHPTQSVESFFNPTTEASGVRMEHRILHGQFVCWNRNP